MTLLRPNHVERLTEAEADIIGPDIKHRVFRWWVDRPLVDGKTVKAVVVCSYCPEAGTQKEQRFQYEFSSEELEKIIPKDVRDNYYALPRAIGKASRQAGDARNALTRLMTDAIKARSQRSVKTVEEILARDDLVEDPDYGYWMYRASKLEALVEWYRKPIAFGGSDRY